MLQRYKFLEGRPDKWRYCQTTLVGGDLSVVRKSTLQIGDSKFINGPMIPRLIQIFLEVKQLFINLQSN
jgi:hypothetical protein